MNNLIEGSYRNGRHSGLIAGVVAGDGTNGHLWACRFAVAPATDLRQVAVIQRLRVRGFTISGYTAAQEVRLAIYKLTAYTAAHSGGTGAVALTFDKKLTGQPAPLLTGRMAGSDQLTAGTHTIATDPLAVGAFAELAAAATVPKGLSEIFISTEDVTQHPIVLQNNEGLLVRNEVAQGGGGTMRLVVEIDHCELQRYPVTTYSIPKGVV